MTIQTAQARAEGLGQLYLDITITDAPYGNPRFILGGVGFLSTNVHGGAPVSPVVLSWVTFQGGASSDISGEGGGSVVLDANAWLTQANGAVRATVASWLCQLNWREMPASLYQWNATESTQALVWSGYVLGVTESRFSGGVYQVELMLSATLRDMERTDISDLITKAAFASAPISSLGKMVPRAYGTAQNTISNSNAAGSLAKVGFPMPGIRGVVIDENQATAKVKVRFSKNDGISAWSAFPTGTSDDAGSYGGLWIYDSGMGAYGMVDNASYTVTNDVDKCEVVVDAAPKVFFYLKPIQVGSLNTFTDAHKAIDSDPANFVTSTAAINSLAFYLPSVSSGGRIKSIGVTVDWFNAHATKNRQVTIGIWDIYANGGSFWLGGVTNTSKPSLKGPGDPRIIVMQDTAAYRSTASYFQRHVATASNTSAEFSAGSFITNNANDVLQATLELRAIVDDLGGANAGKEDVRFYNVGFVIEVDYISRELPSNQGIKDAEDYSLAEEIQQKQYFVQFKEALNRQRTIDVKRAIGTDWFARGAFQKDDGAGKYTGAAAAVIERPQDIAYHILDKVAGQTVNATVATLGNFVDPRTNGVLKDLKVLSQFGPEIVKRNEALERLTQRFPMSLRRKSGVWHCIPDDLNPHSSAVYRSTAEPIWIGPNDFERDSFVDRELDVSDIVNSIQLNYSHGYPDREAAAQTTYENHLSQKWFGKKTTEPYDYPEIHQTDLSVAVDQKATDIAQWLGRRSARPRRIVSCSLSQKFYDLEPGHCLGFQDMEGVGIPQQAYRAGLLDYYFNSAAGGTDYADSSATVLISLTSTKVLIGLSQQTDGLDFSIATAAALTNVANSWRYSIAGGAEGNFANVVNEQALQGTGARRVSWDRPDWWTWVKSEQTLGGITYGPCYWISFNYTNPTGSGLANARTTYPAIWKGRYFKVLTANRRPGRKSKDYPYKDAVLIEVM